MTHPMRVKPSTEKVLLYLNHYWPNFVSVPHLIAGTKQTDVRKRISEAIAAGYDVEKERAGAYVAYRWTA
ncbi:MAG: hypothetical protein D4R80_00980 [Deltaproteobacteria bacterium]|nr:MAG: hypothetical protein D4R80_00980 [Deltaproteobacteria bacterium]